jgi:predicted regulator of amino acid metabolism with ACT domain
MCKLSDLELSASKGKQMENIEITAQAIAEAIEIERKRCASILSAARFHEVDNDLRAIKAMIESGKSVEQIKSL